MVNNNFRVYNKFHPFHVVAPTLGPFAFAFALWSVVTMVSLLLNPQTGTSVKAEVFFLAVAVLFLFTAFFLWGLHVSDEALRGFHTHAVRQGLRFGFVLFIASEVMFFFSIFWAFLHLASIPSVHIGGVWPPAGIHVLDPRGIPLLNTIVLLSSGIFTVWAHRALIAGYGRDAAWAIFGACILGVYFSWLQFMEYTLTDFSINDSVYGSVFFFATGFHGIHVIVGTVLLWVSYCRLVNRSLSRERHLGFELAAWYWHFVDVVWIFLYVLLYWWGSA
jgi:cytochrome c oxidase subunit 3